MSSSSGEPGDPWVPRADAAPADASAASSSPAPPRGYPAPPPSVSATLATAVVVVACLLAAVQVVVFVVSFPAAAEVRGWDGSLSAVGPLYGLYAMASGGVQALASVAFVVAGLWLHGARAFAEAARPEVPQERGRVWVWLGWIVPIVNLWFPLQVVGDIRRGCNPGAARHGIGGWWALWLVFSFSLFFRYTESRSSGGLRVSLEMPLPVVEGISALAGLGALWLWIGIVREITAGRRQFVENLGAARH